MTRSVGLCVCFDLNIKKSCFIVCLNGEFTGAGNECYSCLVWGKFDTFCGGFRGDNARRLEHRPYGGDKRFCCRREYFESFRINYASSHTSEIPHVVKLSIARAEPKNSVAKTWCSCLAGQGTCKHIVAAAMRLFRLSEDMLEPISCTDTAQQWGKSNMKKWSDMTFKGTTLNNMCHFKQSVGSAVSSLATQQDFGKKVRDMFKTSGDQGSELCKFMGRTRCTTKKPSGSSIHKSMKKAMKKVQTCPITTASLPVKTVSGKKCTGATSTTKAKGPVVDKENQMHNLEKKTAGPSRAPLRSLQPAASFTSPGGPSASSYRNIYENIRKERSTPPPATVVPPQIIGSLVRKRLLVEIKPTLDKEDEEYFFSKVSLTPEEAIKLCLSSASQSSSKVWIEERKKRFTASKCYALYTPSASLDDEEFWRRKLKGTILDSSFSGNFNTNRGLTDEPFARRRYEVTYGSPVETVGLVVHPDMPWFGCSPDGIIRNSVLFQTKSPEAGVVNSAPDVARGLSYAKFDRSGNMQLSSRHPYYGQVQLGMALTGLLMCHFVIYASSDDSIALIKVPFDKVFAGALLDKLTKIYFRHYLGMLRELGV